jgi:hypothetical protein
MRSAEMTARNVSGTYLNARPQCGQGSSLPKVQNPRQRRVRLPPDKVWVGSYAPMNCPSKKSDRNSMFGPTGNSVCYRKYNHFKLGRWLNDFILALLAAFIGLFAIHQAGWVGSVSIPGAIIGWLLLIAVAVRLGWLWVQAYRSGRREVRRWTGRWKGHGRRH